MAKKSKVQVRMEERIAELLEEFETYSAKAEVFSSRALAAKVEADNLQALIDADEPEEPPEPDG